MTACVTSTAWLKMTIYGTPYFPKGASFAVPRSHLYRVCFGFGSAVGVSGSGPNFVFNDLINTQNHVICNLHPTLWGSRAYPLTLDHMIDDWWLIVDPNPNPLPLNFV